MARCDKWYYLYAQRYCRAVRFRYLLERYSSWRSRERGWDHPNLSVRPSVCRVCLSGHLLALSVPIASRLMHSLSWAADEGKRIIYP